MFSLFLKRKAYEEQERRRNRSSTFTEPLRKSSDMKEFLMKFYKHIYTDERRQYYRQEQDKYPILKNHYAILVPEHVTYEDFWQRYDYRTDIDRIWNELRLQEETSLSDSFGKVRDRFMNLIPEENTNSTLDHQTDSQTSITTSDANKVIQHQKELPKKNHNIETVTTKEYRDVRLLGTTIYILNDIDESITDMIQSMGGVITAKLEDATHALWIPNSVTHFTKTLESSLASSLSIPIVDADRWLPRVTDLKSNEHWSMINSEEFGPKASPEIPNNEPAETGARTRKAKLNQNSSMSKMAMLNVCMMVLIAVIVSAYANSILHMRQCPGRPNTFLELFCKQRPEVVATVSPRRNNRFRRLQQKLKNRGKKKNTQAGKLHL